MTMTLQDMIWSKEKNKWCTHTCIYRKRKRRRPLARNGTNGARAVLLRHRHRHRQRPDRISYHKPPKRAQVSANGARIYEILRTKQKQNLRAVALSSGAARTADAALSVWVVRLKNRWRWKKTLVPSYAVQCRCSRPPQWIARKDLVLAVVCRSFRRRRRRGMSYVLTSTPYAFFP